MKILIVNKHIIPVHTYGGTERVIWGLAKELTKLGYEVTFLVPKGSSCSFASVIYIDENKPILEQVNGEYDVVHFNFRPEGVENTHTPYVITMHSNSNDLSELDRNTVFISQNHAERYGSTCYVYNGLDWSEYSIPDLTNKRDYFHFLGKAAWRVKNVSGAIDVIKKTKSEKLRVLGGVRFNFKMGLRFTFSPRISFEGMVGGEKKFALLNRSKGLVFPVKWHEPFGLAMTESLYYGCPVFGTPYGSLPELIKEDVGFLSKKSDELTEAILNVDSYSRKRCHEYVVEEFNAKKMALGYLKKYETVISGIKLNDASPKLLEVQEKKWLDWDRV